MCKSGILVELIFSLFFFERMNRYINVKGKYIFN